MSFTVVAHTLKISSSDSVSAEVYQPQKPIAILVLAHGAGANMHHKFMKDLAAEFATLNIATLRYNFLYMELKKKRPDFPAVAHKAVAAAIAKAHELFPKLPLYAGGKSFGGRMTSQYMSANHIPHVKGLVFVGFPLHAAGNPGIERADHLNTIKQPMLFLQGSRDALAEWSLIEKVCKKLPSATLVRFENADHSFKSGKLNLIPDLAAKFNQWISN